MNGVENPVHKGFLGDGSPAKRKRLSADGLRRESLASLVLHTQASDLLCNACTRLNAGIRVSTAPLASIIHRLADSLDRDTDALVSAFALQQSRGEYLFDHCINAALLSMSMAAHLGADRQQTEEIGMGTLFHDAGMIRVPHEIRLAPRPLQPTEVEELRRHPIYTRTLLEQVDGLTSAARMIGYQVHERTDGSGYPRRRSAATIHPYAKIAAVADVFAAMVRVRPHRAPQTPYEAVKTILADTKRGRFDRRVVRAFLDCVSVFPVGSYVALRKGIVGRVLRANPGAHTQPVVVEIDSFGEPTDWVIDLSKDPRLKVTRVLPRSEIHDALAIGG